MANRKLYKQQILADYPNVPEYIVDWSLDILEQDGGTDFFKALMKRKQGRRKSTAKDLEKPAVKEYELKCLEIIQNKEQDPEYELPKVQDLTLNDNGEIKELPYTLKFEG